MWEMSNERLTNEKWEIWETRNERCPKWPMKNEKYKWGKRNQNWVMRYVKRDVQNENWGMWKEMWYVRNIIQTCEVKMRCEEWETGYAKWEMRCAKWEMRCAKWEVSFAEWELSSGKCEIRYTEWELRYAKWNLRNTKWDMRNKNEKNEKYGMFTKSLGF